MAVQATFEIQVRDHISEILKQRYGTTRHGSNPLDKGEETAERRFWPDMQFHDVGQSQSQEGDPVVEISFTPVYERENTYGYRINVNNAVEAWSKRLGIINPQHYPARFAAEILWYMVTYIGSLKIERCPEDARGIRWINRGDDVFTRLPDAHDHRH